MYSHGVCFMPSTLNISLLMGSGQIYNIFNKKKRDSRRHEEEAANTSESSNSTVVREKRR